MAATAPAAGDTVPNAPTDPLVRIAVWDLPVRVTHWVNVFCIVVLSITGYYISQPFLFTRGSARDHFLMGTVRFVHFVVAFVFTGSVFFRIYWAFAGNRWAGWRQLVPSTTKRWRLLRQQLAYYTFLRRKPPQQVGHNPLAGLSYLAIYILFIIQVLTGFGLYSLAFQGGFWPAAFGWMPLMVGATTLRLVHDLVMFAFFAFTIHHVYSAILIDVEERSGLVSSIVTGYKSLSREHIREGSDD